LYPRAASNGEPSRGRPQQEGLLGTNRTTFTGLVRNARGVHALWLQFEEEGADLFQVDWFRFGASRKKQG
jgi:hypothetical protein